MHDHPHAPAPALARLVPTLDLPANPKCAVDVGCGRGDDVRWLRDAGFRAIGIDSNGDVLAAAAAATDDARGIDWIQADAMQLPLDEDSCVLVTDRGCLHHIAPADRANYAREVARVLVPGGVWLVRDAIGHHHQVAELDTDELGRLAEAAGLRFGSDAPADGASSGWLVAVLRKPAHEPG